MLSKYPQRQFGAKCCNITEGTEQLSKSIPGFDLISTNMKGVEKFQSIHMSTGIGNNKYPPQRSSVQEMLHKNTTLSTQLGNFVKMPRTPTSAPPPFLRFF